MAERWRNIAKAACVWLAVFGLLTACASQRQIPQDAPSATPAIESGAPSSAAPSSATRSRASESESSPPTMPPAASQTESPTASENASPKAPPTKDASPSAEAPASSPATSAGKETAAPNPKPASPPPDRPASPAPSATPAVKQVTISVVGNAEWGTILKPEKTALQKNDTVADVLIRTLKAHKLAYEKRGSGALLYVTGIDGLYEFDDGPTSGWKYRVNGKEPGVGAGSFKPEPGDKVEWFYTAEDTGADSSSDGKGSAP